MQCLSFEQWLNIPTGNDNYTNEDRRGVQKLLEILDKLPPLRVKGPWLVGGTLRRILVHKDLETDIDIMFKDRQQFDDYCGQMRERGAEIVEENDRQTTYEYEGWKVQPICAEFSNTLRQTLNKFDFTICQFGYDGTNLIWADEAMEHLKKGLLVFTQTNDYVSSLRRAFKYAKQGFFMDQESVAKFLKKVTENAGKVHDDTKKWEAEAHASGGFRPSGSYA